MSYGYQGPPVAFPGQKPPTSFGVPPGTPSASSASCYSQIPTFFNMSESYFPHSNAYPSSYPSLSGQSMHQTYMLQPTIPQSSMPQPSMAQPSMVQSSMSQSSMPQPSMIYSNQNFSLPQSAYKFQEFSTYQKKYFLQQSQQLHHFYPMPKSQHSQTYNQLQLQQNPYPLQSFAAHQDYIVSQNPTYTCFRSATYPNLNNLEKSDPIIPTYNSGLFHYPSKDYSGGQGSSGNLSYGGSILHNSLAPQMAQVVTKLSPTVILYPNLDARVDAEILRKAMKGFGTDEKSIIQILANRTNLQRQEIATQFKTLYGKDLIKDLKSETSGNFENLLVAMMTPLPQFYAKELYEAMNGIGTEENVLIEVLCTMSNHEIQVIKQAYKTMFGKSLEDDLIEDTSGNFKRLMVSLSCGNRDESFQIDHAAAINDAKQLLQAGELRFGTDESTFNAILVQRNIAQLKQIFTEYQNLTGHDIEAAIENEFSGDIKKGLLGIIKCVKNRAGFFAEQIYKSMKGLGTEDQRLIRLIITRSEIDMGEIKQAFMQQYGQSLENFISDDCTGSYKKCLLVLIS